MSAPDSQNARRVPQRPPGVRLGKVKRTTPGGPEEESPGVVLMSWWVRSDHGHQDAPRPHLWPHDYRTMVRVGTWYVRRPRTSSIWRDGPLGLLP